jgi:cytoskeletal protein CcmA (bactofilin family)
LDNSGLHIRKLNQAGTGYEPEEIKIVENSIVFSNDNFATAKMAIGKFVDANLGITWGIVAPNIVGTILAGSNLVIESAKQSGGTSVFKVDANGATLYNSTFTVTDGVTKVGINGTSGFAIGDMNLYSDANFTIDPTHAYLYIDTNGKLVTKSIIQASDYLDSSGNSMLDVLGRFKSDFLNLGNITLDTVTGDITTSGDVTLGGNINITGNITWSESNSPVQVQYSVDGVTSWHTTYASTDYFARYSYDGGVTWTSAVRIQGTDGSDANVPAWVSSMQSTYIDGQWVISPNIYGGTITSGSTIDVTTDLRVGNNVYIGNSLDLSTEKMLRFTNSANITALNDNLTISCDYLFLSPSVVDFSGAGSIYWGTNAPVARFG